ncbi:MAG: precorrin-2 C(20)-methyltransferase [Pseudomonadota bacterium]
MSAAHTGTLYGLGVGPGDPELITLKAHRILQACPVVSYPAPDTGPSFARSIAAQFIPDTAIEVPIVVPMKVARFPAQAVYDTVCETLAEHLLAGRDVAVLCEGDPFFYGSFMYVYERLGPRFPCEIVPGISSMMAGGAAIQRPLAARNDVLTVLPAPLDDGHLEAGIAASDAVCFIKVGRHLPRLRTLIERMGLMDRASYLERISLGEQRLAPLAQVPADPAPYFSMVLLYKGAEAWIETLALAPDTEPSQRHTDSS